MALVNLLLTVNHFNDRKLLEKIYKNVYGSLKGSYGDGINYFVVDEQNDPFSKLPPNNSETIYPYFIYAKLNEQETLRAVSFKIKKSVLYREPYKKSILDWITTIDFIMNEEMIDKYHKNKSLVPRPTYGTLEIECLDNMNELLWACRLSKHVTHIIPTKHGVYISNENCVNMQWIALSPNSGANYINNFHFNKDIGFNGSISTDMDNENLNYLNDHFVIWKANNYAGKLSDYFETDYPEMFENEIVNEFNIAVGYQAHKVNTSTNNTIIGSNAFATNINVGNFNFDVQSPASTNNLIDDPSQQIKANAYVLGTIIVTVMLCSYLRKEN